MNSKIILTSSAIILGIIGIVLTFLPQEILSAMQNNESADFVIILQLLGALYLGFAIQNWFVKSSMIGGIYNKPILMGNILHFTIAAFALIKSDISFSFFGYNITVIITVLYALFALMFFILTFSKPKTQQS